MPTPSPARPPLPQEQALRKAAELQQQAREGLEGARKVAADLKRGDAQAASAWARRWLRAARAGAGARATAALPADKQALRPPPLSVLTAPLPRRPPPEQCRHLACPHVHRSLHGAFVGETARAVPCSGRRSCWAASGARAPAASHSLDTHLSTPAHPDQVCIYFFNSVYDRYASWRQLAPPADASADGAGGLHNLRPPAGFPTLSVALLLPCAVFTALGVKALYSSAGAPLPTPMAPLYPGALPACLAGQE